MAYDDVDLDESIGWCVLAGVIIIMLFLCFAAYLVLGPGRIDRRDVRAESRYRDTLSAPSAPPPCAKEGVRDAWTCSTSLPTLGGTAVEGL